MTTQTVPAIVPNFDDDTTTGRKLAIICSKGNLDMAYPGLVLANAALGEGVQTHLFFTFWGFDMITKSRMRDLKFTPLGNTATHMPQGLGGIPGMTAMATHMMKKQIADVGVPEVPEFLEQIVASGGHLWACRMSADMMHLTENDLYDERVDVDFLDGEAYDIRVRGHRVLVDQPADLGGADRAPTPTELFVGSLAACVAFYAGRYLTRHGFDRDGLEVHADFDMATDRPARVAAIRITVRVPDDFPAERRAALAAVASHCTVHNTLTTQPDVTVAVE